MLLYYGLGILFLRGCLYLQSLCQRSVPRWHGLKHDVSQCALHTAHVIQKQEFHIHQPLQSLRRQRDLHVVRRPHNLLCTIFINDNLRNGHSRNLRYLALKLYLAPKVKYGKFELAEADLRRAAGFRPIAHLGPLMVICRSLFCDHKRPTKAHLLSFCALEFRFPLVNYINDYHLTSSARAFCRSQSSTINTKPSSKSVIRRVPSITTTPTDCDHHCPPSSPPSSPQNPSGNIAPASQPPPPPPPLSHRVLHPTRHSPFF